MSPIGSLDPEIAALLPALNRGFPRVETMTAPQLRAVIAERAVLLQNPEPVARVTDRTVPGPGGNIKIRIYWPSAPAGSLPIVVFAHGGGFVFCGLDSHDDLCRAMTNGVGAIVVSVDYRLAPESRWPAAVDDVYAVAAWAAEQADGLGAGPARMVLAGDSAGGNLATVTALLARDRGRPEIAGQLLCIRRSRPTSAPSPIDDLATATTTPLRQWPGTGTSTFPTLPIAGIPPHPRCARSWAASRPRW